MDLVIGGAYQGKLEYARTAFGLKEEDIFFCGTEAPFDREKRCLCHYENYVRYCMKARASAGIPFREDAVILFEDIFCGVVPVDAEIRAWREQAGRVLSRLAEQADTVTRLFCGIPQRVKG